MKGKMHFLNDCGISKSPEVHPWSRLSELMLEGCRIGPGKYSGKLSWEILWEKASAGPEGTRGTSTLFSSEVFYDFFPPRQL